jgi:hypothetical protein
MKKANEIYQNTGRYDAWHNYQPMLNEFGKIVIQEDGDDYSGDTYVLYELEKGYGFLKFGWGSCSSCDALEGCETIEEVQELMDDLLDQIQVFKTKKSALSFFKNHDWEGDYDYNYHTRIEFVKKVIEYFEGM